MSDILSGYKTYIGGVVLVGIGALIGVGIEVPGFDGQTPGSLISTGLMFIFTRMGISKI